MTGMSGGTGLLLLCETELSNPVYEIPTGSYNAKEEAEKHNCLSTKGVGRTVPLAWKDASCVNKDLKGIMMVSLASLSSPILQHSAPYGTVLLSLIFFPIEDVLLGLRPPLPHLISHFLCLSPRSVVLRIPFKDFPANSKSISLTVHPATTKTTKAATSSTTNTSSTTSLKSS